MRKHFYLTFGIKTNYLVSTGYVVLIILCNFIASLSLLYYNEKSVIAVNLERLVG